MQKMENEKTDFPVKLELRIDWAELDLFGHVNNVMFFKYAQAARVNYWEQIGLYQHFRASDEGPMVAAVNCQFRKPLFYPGTVTIYSRMKEIGNTSFRLQHQMVADSGALCAEVEDAIVMYDFKKE
ncbi:MAG: acyl-CoA thioesterase, partial [Sphingobacteriales bacterium]